MSIGRAEERVLFLLVGLFIHVFSLTPFAQATDPIPCINEALKVSHALAKPSLESLLETHNPRIRYVIREALSSRGISTVDPEDLYQEVVLELVKLHERWDPETAEFMTYARHRIQGAILDALRSEDPASILARQDLARIQMLQDEAQLVLGANELATELGLSRERVLDAFAAGSKRRAKSIFQANEDGETTLEISSLDSSHVRSSEVEIQEIPRLDEDYRRILSDQEFRVIEEVVLQGREAKALAVDMGVDESYISQLRSRALKRIKDSMIAEREEVYSIQQAFSNDDIRRQLKSIQDRSTGFTIDQLNRLEALERQIKTRASILDPQLQTALDLWLFKGIDEKAGTQLAKLRPSEIEEKARRALGLIVPPLVDRAPSLEQVLDSPSLLEEIQKFGAVLTHLGKAPDHWEILGHSREIAESLAQNRQVILNYGASLSDHQRQVIELMVGEGLSQAETARRMGLASHASVSTGWKDAVKNIRAMQKELNNFHTRNIDEVLNGGAARDAYQVIARYVHSQKGHLKSQREIAQELGVQAGDVRRFFQIRRAILLRSLDLTEAQKVVLKSFFFEGKSQAEIKAAGQTTNPHRMLEQIASGLTVKPVPPHSVALVDIAKEDGLRENLARYSAFLKTQGLRENPSNYLGLDPSSIEEIDRIYWLVQGRRFAGENSKTSNNIEAFVFHLNDPQARAKLTDLQPGKLRELAQSSLKGLDPPLIPQSPGFQDLVENPTFVNEMRLLAQLNAGLGSGYERSARVAHLTKLTGHKPQQVLAMLEIQDAIRSHAEGLTEAQRKVLVSWFIEGKRRPDIATEMGTSPGNVSTTMKRAASNVQKLQDN